MKKNRITALLISLSLVLIVALGAVPSFARYIMKQGKQSELVSDNFYFSSDYLKADETPTYTLWENSVTFQARNYIDVLRINAVDISYTVTVETAGEGITLSQSNGTLTGGAQNAEFRTILRSKSLPKALSRSIEQKNKKRRYKVIFRGVSRGFYR